MLHHAAWPRPAPQGDPALFGIAATIGLLLGIGGCLCLPRLPPWPVLALSFALGFGAWLRQGRMRLAGAALLGFGLCGLHAASTLAQQLPPALELQEVMVTGRIVDLPQHEARRTRFRLRVDRSGEHPALGGRSLQLAWYDDYGSDEPGPRMRLGAGERWRFRVKLRAPRGLRNPGGFDSERYALAQRLVATGYVRAPGSALRLSPPEGIDAWRQQVSRRIDAMVPRASSRFVRALAVGDTSGLGDRDWEILRANGLTHLIAISGFHVGLVAGFFALLANVAWWAWPALGRRLPRPLGAGLAAITGAALYTAVAGFALPTVRTALMIGIVVSARLWRRPQRPFEALALAAMGVLLVDPLSPLAPGFWLSFVGVAWLLWCLPHGTGRPLRDFIGAQGVATLGLLPLTVVLFGQASLAGPLANMVAVPWWSLVVVPLALLGTGLDAIHGGLGAWAWQLAAWAFDASWPLFERLAGHALALWWLPRAQWFALPLALLGAFWLLLPRGVPGKPLALLLWLPLLWPQRDLPRPGEAELVVIDVGQGLSVLVRTSRHALLYDMGPAVPDGFDAGERAVVPALHALGVRRLDAAIASHGDNDHAGGLDAVRRTFLLPLLLSPPGSPVRRTRPCLAGTRWRWDGVEFHILHPPVHFPYLANESSCVLRIRTRHGAALLTGDIGEAVERGLLRLRKEELHNQVVLIPHHGSAGSSEAEFVAATGARHALASAGYANRFRHPARAVVERWQAAGAEVESTLDSGALRVRLGQDGVRVSAEREDHARLWDAVNRRPPVQFRDWQQQPGVFAGLSPAGKSRAK